MGRKGVYQYCITFSHRGAVEQGVCGYSDNIEYLRIVAKELSYKYSRSYWVEQKLIGR